MIDRKIATLARELVEARRETSHDHQHETEYRALCEGLPILLRTAGLTRTVTFLDAKKQVNRDGEPENEYAFLLAHLRIQLEAAEVYSDAKTQKLDLSRYVISSELSTLSYSHVSKLAFRVAYWHKRMAQALLRQRDDER